MAKIDEQLERIYRLDEGKPRKSIVILGAGMAGLSAAYELSLLKHHVSVIEASGRIGGRVWTRRFNEGTNNEQYHEFGAMRVPTTHDFTRYYINAMGLKCRPFVTAHKDLDCFYYVHGIKTEIKNASQKLFPAFDLSPWERHLAQTMVAPAIMGVEFGKVLSELTEEDIASLFGHIPFTPRVADLDEQSLGEFLERRTQGRDARELVGVTTGLEVWWDKAVTMFIRDEVAGEHDLDEIEGGMDLLPRYLANNLPVGTIRLNTEVVSIALTERGVKLHVRTPDEEGKSNTAGEWKEETCDYVICTIPFSVLRGMHLEGLSARKMRAIRNLTYASSTKVLLYCRERFWEGPPYNIAGGASLTDLMTRATYYPSDNASSAAAALYSEERPALGYRGLHTAFARQSVPPADRKVSNGPGVLVGSYNWGQDARRLGAMGKNQRAEHVIDDITNFHPEIKDFVEDHDSKFWGEERWARGAFCFMRPGDLRDYYQDTIRPEGRLHFAGEHCSLDQAWIQGAIVSGLRAAEEIIAREF